MTDPTSWLAQRLAEAPAELRECIERAVQRDANAVQREASAAQRAACSVQRDEQPVQRAAYSVQRTAEAARFEEELRLVAEDLLAAAKNGPPTHDTALTLLAADALITLACEWVAETEPQRLGEIR